LVASTLLNRFVSVRICSIVPFWQAPWSLPLSFWIRTANRHVVAELIERKTDKANRHQNSADNHQPETGLREH
jgi:hypothetical protein